MDDLSSFEDDSRGGANPADLAQDASLQSTRQNDTPISERVVVNLLRARGSRKTLFDDSLFADPAWDMLLELYAARLGNRKISVSSLCIAADVPTTTALRWIAVLADGGWIVRRDDPGDGRRTFVHLTPKAVAALESFFRRWGPREGI